MVRTTEVFTPNRTPTFTSVDRSGLREKLDDYIDQGGAFVSVLGTTKLGKSTLIKSAMTSASFHTYIPGQNLISGVSSLWNRLAADLGIPTSTTTGKVVGNKSRWSFFAKFGLMGTEAGAEAGGEHSVDDSKDMTYEQDAPSAVAFALSTLAVEARKRGELPPMIVIDDFHFVTSADTRRDLIWALRTVTDNDCSVILATLPGRESEEAFGGTQVGGRHYPLTVPIWADEELREIATTGFEVLKVTASPGLIDVLVGQSYGSPHLMQQLCLNLCRSVNQVRDDSSPGRTLQEPENWAEFFREVRDPHSVSWLEKLGIGLKQRNPRKVKAEVDGRQLDGYQLILWALHQLGARSEVEFVAIRDFIADLPSVTVNVTRFALEQKAKNMNVLASREMTQALELHGAETSDDADETEGFTEDEVRVAGLIPQPVFEVVGTHAANMKVRILDPLLAYTLAWHPEAFAR